MIDSSLLSHLLTAALTLLSGMCTLMFESIMVLLHNICQNSSGAEMAHGFGPVCAASSSFHVLGFM